MLLRERKDRDDYYVCYDYVLINENSKPWYGVTQFLLYNIESGLSGPAKYFIECFALLVLYSIRIVDFHVRKSIIGAIGCTETDGLKV